ncbi:MAG: NADH-quinone oxidoreductase subunit NuoK [Candidatus Eisenbacteria bacterium]|nr:NADH-quinone oxidoreductase subunit NuoK [Candidatus Eisenbacteria bacterium]
MAHVPVAHVLILSGILFGIGLIGLLARRNLVFVLMSLEMMLNAAVLAFAAAGSRWGQPDGQVMILFLLATAAAEVSVGLPLLLRISGRFGTVDGDDVSGLRG